MHWQPSKVGALKEIVKMHFLHHHIVTIAVTAAIVAVVVVSTQQNRGSQSKVQPSVNMKLVAHPIVIVGR